MLDVDLLSDELVVKKADAKFYLSRDAFKRHQVDNLWEARAATSAKAVTKALLTDKVVEEVRGELRRQTGYLADRERIAQVLREEIVHPDGL